MEKVKRNMKLVEKGMYGSSKLIVRLGRRTPVLEHWEVEMKKVMDFQALPVGRVSAVWTVQGAGLACFCSTLILFFRIEKIHL